MTGTGGSAAVLAVFLLSGAQTAPGDRQLFNGTWTADAAQSRQHPADRSRNQTLRISIAGDTVTIVDTIVNPSGREERRTNTFQIDGKEHPHPVATGFILVASLKERVIETVAKKGNVVLSRFIYQVSADGKTLTTRAYDAGGTELMAIVFARD